MTDDPTDPADRTEPETPEQRRLRGFAKHISAYFLFLFVAIPVNFFYTPDDLWVILPAVVWGAPLALHAAWAMGLFDGLFGGSAGSGRG